MGLTLISVMVWTGGPAISRESGLDGVSCLAHLSFFNTIILLSGEGLVCRLEDFLSGKSTLLSRNSWAAGLSR